MTNSTPFEGVLTVAVRSAIICELVDRPETLLSELSILLSGDLGEIIGDIRICELLEARARSASCSVYDRRIVEAVRAAATLSVSPAYVRDRVGGSRWKRQAAILRLIESGEIVRTGTTGGTRYWSGNKSE